MPVTSQERADRRTGVVVGVLFIIATAFLFLGEAFYKSFLDAPDALTVVAQHKPQVVFGLGIELVCILAMPLIGAFIYPVLSRVSTGVALTYFFFRSLEAVILIAVAQVNKWSILSLSEAYQSTGTPAPFETALVLIRAQNAWGDTAGQVYNVAFVCGALCLYATLYSARLVPRWLSGWGLLAAVILGGTVVASIFVPIAPAVTVALLLPIGLQEMVMALWFIWRGFDESALREADVSEAVAA